MTDSAFGVDHGEISKGMFAMPGAFRAAATSAAQKPMAAAGKLKPKMAGAAGAVKNQAFGSKPAAAATGALGGAGAQKMYDKNKTSKPKPPTNRV